jgi:hypothetical protein
MVMDEEPAEAEEDFQFALVNVLKKMQKSLEDISASLKELKEKIGK